MIEERVQKYIQLSGLCSRRKAEDLIAKHKVKVNGKTVKLGDKCLPTDEIEVEGRKIKFKSDSKIYIVLNKPKGYVCSKDDPHNKETIYDLVPKNRSLFSIGRLDKDTTGLIILTNDGKFSQNVIHPSKKIEKTYELDLDKKLSEDDKLAIENGLILDGQRLSKCKIKHFKENRYQIKIFEGKKRQIRRVFEMKNYKVTKLNRVAIGNLKLSSFNIKVGNYKIVDKIDLNPIFS